MVCHLCAASVAQLGERQTEDLKVPGPIPGRGTFTRRRSLLLPPRERMAGAFQRSILRQEAGAQAHSFDKRWHVVRDS